MPLRKNPKEFGSFDKYLKFVKQFPLQKKFLVGNFYSFYYDLDETDQYAQKLRYYDEWPLIFFYGIRKGHTNIMQGINFHHLPVNVREQVMGLFKQYVTEDFNNDRRLIRFSKWRNLWLLHKKAISFCTRQYDINKIRMVRNIPNSKMEESIQYYSNTYNGATISDVEKNYRTFIW